MQPLYSKTTQRYLDRLSQPVSTTKSALKKRPAKTAVVENAEEDALGNKKPLDKEIEAKSEKPTPASSKSRPKNNYAAMTTSRKYKTIEPKAQT